VAVVLVAVPAIMATSPEHDSRSVTAPITAALDADHPAAAFVGTIELDRPAPERLPGASVRTIAGPDQPPVRVLLAPADGGGEMGTGDHEEYEYVRFPCGDPCRVAVRVVVELADESGRPWQGTVELEGKGSVKAGSDVRVTLARDTERTAPTRARPEPVAISRNRPAEQVAAEVDPTLVARGRPPGASDAVVVRVSGPTEAVRRSQYALVVAGGGSLHHVGGPPGYEPRGAALAINPGERCAGPTCRDEFVVTTEPGATVSATSLTAPVPGVEVELLEGLGLHYQFDQNDSRVVTIPVPAGWALIAEVDGYGYSGDEDDIPARLLRRSGSTTEDIGGDQQPQLVPVATCPPSDREGCSVTLESKVIQGGDLHAFVIPPAA
jgi:hypothetical protein